jgi:hypothetical protein
MVSYPVETSILVQFWGEGDTANVVHLLDTLESRGYKPELSHLQTLIQVAKVNIIVGGQYANPVFADAVSKGWIRAITDADDGNPVVQTHSEGGFDYIYPASSNESGTLKSINQMLDAYFSPDGGGGNGGGNGGGGGKIDPKVAATIAFSVIAAGLIAGGLIYSHYSKKGK